MRANSAIYDPDHTEVGQLISVPAIPVRVKPLPTEVWWVQVEEKDNLEAAINVLRSHPEDAPPIRIVPYWNGKKL